MDRDSQTKTHRCLPCLGPGLTPQRTFCCALRCSARSRLKAEWQRQNMASSCRFLSKEETCRQLGGNPISKLRPPETRFSLDDLKALEDCVDYHQAKQLASHGKDLEKLHRL